jgi:hypothetical protein
MPGIARMEAGSGYLSAYSLAIDSAMLPSMYLICRFGVP